MCIHIYICIYIHICIYIYMSYLHNLLDMCSFLRTALGTTFTHKLSTDKGPLTSLILTEGLRSPRVIPMLKGLYWEPQTKNKNIYSINIIGIYLPESLSSIIFLLYSWGSWFGVPSKVLSYVSPGSPRAGPLFEKPPPRALHVEAEGLRSKTPRVIEGFRWGSCGWVKCLPHHFYTL